VAEEVAEFKAAGAAAAPTGNVRIRALLVPAKDGGDAAAAQLLGRLLDPADWEVETAPPETLPAELLDRLAADEPAAVVIVSLPPGGLTHTRYLCKRIRQRFPGVKIVVCRWTAPGEDGDAAGADPLRAAGADEVTTRLESTRTFLHGWRAVIAETVTAKAEPVKKRGGKAIGTTRA
jgi:methylmalonyl-CoA mutase cobalamin-binding subunit